MARDLSTVTRWGKIPAWWLLHPAIDSDSFCVMAALSTYADDHGCCDPSQATLARHLGRSRPWVNKVIGSLVKIGILEKTGRSRRNGGTTSCLYRLVQTPDELDAVSHETPHVLPPDTPRHQRDTSQIQLKQVHYPRSPARAPTDTHRHEACQALNAATSPMPSVEPVPAGWEPSAAAVIAAEKLAPGSNVHAHAMMFSTRCRAKGYRYAPAHLDDAWLSWIAEDTLRGGRSCRSLNGQTDRPIGKRREPSEVAEGRYGAWVAAASTPRQPTISAWS